MAFFRTEQTQLVEPAASLRAQVDPSRLPAHVAIIMDGNGRWARRRGLPRIAGHRRGAESARAVITAARTVGVGVLTLYAFSIENWKRPKSEIDTLMSLLVEYLKKEEPGMRENRIRFCAIGDLDLLPPAARETVQGVVSRTAGHAGLRLNLALNYGGRNEIVRAVRRLGLEIAKGTLDPASIDETAISRALDTAGLPDPDLLIRTSGEKRISNFLLWQTAYAELHFTETLWPDFREEDFLKAILDFQKRERRFGLTGEQVRDQHNGR